MRANGSLVRARHIINQGRVVIFKKSEEITPYFKIQGKDWNDRVENH